MANDSAERLIIESVNLDDKKFRPTDWVERIASLWARFGRDQRLRYAPSIYPCVIGGEKCLVVEKGLQTRDPAAYAFILQFATHNRLKVHEDRRAQASPAPNERRDAQWDYRHFVPEHDARPPTIAK